MPESGRVTSREVHFISLSLDKHSSGSRMQKVETKEFVYVPLPHSPCEVEKKVFEKLIQDGQRIQDYSTSCYE